MKRLFLLSTLIFLSTFGVKAQSASDLFTKSATKIYWLGIDFSHVKLIGDFAQFSEAGEAGPLTIRNKYFPGWNNLILTEYAKYDVGGMFRKESINFKTNAITKINALASTEEMEDESEPYYTKEMIQNFIKGYDFLVKEGIGMLFVAESLNKYREVGKYHFVALNLATNEILIHEVFEGKAGGIGLRNYWARSFYEVIIQIRDEQFRVWKKEYGTK